MFYIHVSPSNLRRGPSLISDRGIFMLKIQMTDIAKWKRLFAKTLANLWQTFRSSSGLESNPMSNFELISYRSKLLRVEKMFEAGVTLCRATPRLSWLLFTVGRGQRHACFCLSLASRAASSTSSGLPSLLSRPHCYHCRAEDAAMGASPPPEPPPPAGCGAGAGQRDRPPGHLVSGRGGRLGVEVKKVGRRLRCCGGS